MPDNDLNNNDYARTQVRDGTSSGLHLALIIIGGTIGFAVFLVAAQIGGSLGYIKAALAFFLGSLVLGVLGSITSHVGARTRLSTYLLTQYAFGLSGAKLVNIAVALSLIGWYGVISNFMGQAAQQMLLETLGINVSLYITVLIVSALIITVTAAGFTGIDKLAMVLVPVMGLFIIYVAFISLWKGNVGESRVFEGSFTFQTAVSAVVGSYIAGVIIQPDYSRFAVNARQATWSVFIALGLVFPLIQLLAAIPSMALGEPDLLKVMSILGLLLPAFFLLVLGAWSSNVLCLYSSALSIATLSKKPSLAFITISIGIIGTAIAFVPAQDYLINFLVLLGIAIPPIGAIYTIEVIFVRRFQLSENHIEGEALFKWKAFVAWAAAIVAGYVSQIGILGVFNIASLDSLLVSCAVYLVLNIRRGRSV